MLEEEAQQDSPYDAADPKAVNAARKKAARLRKKRLDFVKAAMDTHEGRMWIYEVLCMCHMAENTEDFDNPHKTSFKNGQRNVGLKILADVSEAASEKYMLMLQEGKAE